MSNNTIKDGGIVTCVHTGGIRLGHPCMVFGLNDIKEVRGCPAGRQRLRMRVDEFALVFVSTVSPNRTTRCFYVQVDDDGGYSCGPEKAANITLPCSDPEEATEEDGWDMSLESHGIVVS